MSDEVRAADHRCPGAPKIEPRRCRAPHPTPRSTPRAPLLARCRRLRRLERSQYSLRSGPAARGRAGRIAHLVLLQVLVGVEGGLVGRLEGHAARVRTGTGREVHRHGTACWGRRGAGGANGGKKNCLN